MDRLRMSEAMSRRGFLGAAAALPFVGALPAAADQGGSASSVPGLIVRQKSPDNLEGAFPSLDGTITPTERFFVRSHFAVPQLDARTWRLRVEGAVKQPLELSLDDLEKLAAKTLPATLECAGNGRVFLTPRPSGLLWELGAVGSAEWTGLPLASVLDKAGVADGAVEVVLEGADVGTVADPASPGPIHYARSLPLEKARKPEVLLATQMNGKPLTPAHGYPVRAVVPGWYGMASVKWLMRLLVVDKPFQGFYQTLDYSVWKRENGLPVLVPLTEMEVKSQVARPSLGEVVPAGKPYRVFGAAWSGESEVTKVEVSTDGGKSWSEATLLGKSIPFTWRLWEHSWKVPEKGGAYTVMARATDRSGRVQPMQRDSDRRTYMISHVLPIEVEVR